MTVGAIIGGLLIFLFVTGLAVVCIVGTIQMTWDAISRWRDGSWRAWPNHENSMVAYWSVVLVAVIFFGGLGVAAAWTVCMAVWEILNGRRPEGF